MSSTCSHGYFLFCFRIRHTTLGPGGLLYNGMLVVFLFEGVDKMLRHIHFNKIVLAVDNNVLGAKNTFVCLYTLPKE